MSLCLLVAGVLAGQVITAGAAISQDVTGVGITEINDGTAVGSNGALRARSRGIGEGDGAKVGKGDELAARLKVLDDPLGVGLAQGARGAGELVLDLSAGRQVLEHGDTGRLAGGVDVHLDLVADAEVKAPEGVRVVGDPFVPGVEAAVTVKGNTGLQDGRLAGIAVDADPGRGRRVCVSRYAGDRNGAADAGEALADLDDARPVARVLDLGVGSVGNQGTGAET